MLLSGCPSKINYSYTNILDDKSKSDFLALLQSVNVEQASIDEYIRLVDLYNATKYPKTLKPGYSTVNAGKKIYNYTIAIDCWTSGNAEMEDINCRIAAFVLMKSYINMPQSATNNKNFYLQKEIQNDFYTLSDTDILKYNAVFTTPEMRNKINFILSIKENWDSMGLTFSVNSPIKLILVYAQFTERENFSVAHAGVLLEKDARIFFIEKTDPMLPFQVSEFTQKNELASYLENRFNEKPFRLYILENDRSLRQGENGT